MLHFGTPLLNSRPRRLRGAPLASIENSRWFDNPLIRKFSALVSEDLSATYSRDIQKWLLVAPFIGVASGLVITGIALLILSGIWSEILPFLLAHPDAIVPVTLFGFLLTGLIMQFLTPD